MTVETLAFIFGALLILIGILGGGFEAKEIKIPKIAGIARLFSFIVGISFIGLGFSMPINGGLQNGTSDNSNQPVYFTIQDEIRAEDISNGYEGQTTVHIDGRSVGTITVNPSFPKSSITVSMQKKGRYKYVVETSAHLNNNENATIVNCIGDGEIDVDSGKAYQVEGRYDGNKCILWLNQILFAP